MRVINKLEYNFSCIEGFFENESKLCIRCDKNCKTCSSAEECTVCLHPNTVPPTCNLRSECIFVYTECNF